MKRSFLPAALAALALSARPGAAATPTLTDAPYEMTKVADGIYAFITAEPKTALVSGNTVAIVGDDGVLVFDTGHFPSVTRRIIADLRKVTDQPVRYVVNSHWHYDHLMGNAVFVDAYPGLRLIVHSFTADQMEKKVRPYPQKLLQQIPAAVESLKKTVVDGKGADGKALSPDDLEAKRLLLNDAEAVLPEAAVMKFRAPDITFDRDLEVHLGKRAVRVLHLGRGNTGGDAMVYVPDAKVIATGDVVVSPVPYAYDGYGTEWIAVLKQIEAMDAAIIVPGHGPVMNDRKYLDRVIAMLESIDSQVRAAYKPGAKIDDIRPKVDLAKFRADFAGTDPHRNFVFTDAIAGPAIERSFEEVQFSTE